MWDQISFAILIHSLAYPRWDEVHRVMNVDHMTIQEHASMGSSSQFIKKWNESGFSKILNIIGIMYRLKHMVPSEILSKVYNGMIKPHTLWY